MIPTPPRSTLFPYTTLFRSNCELTLDCCKFSLEKRPTLLRRHRRSQSLSTRIRIVELDEILKLYGNGKSAIGGQFLPIRYLALEIYSYFLIDIIFPTRLRCIAPKVSTTWCLRKHHRSSPPTSTAPSITGGRDEKIPFADFRVPDYNRSPRR